MTLLQSMLVSARIGTADMHMSNTPGVNTYHMYRFLHPALKASKLLRAQML